MIEEKLKVLTNENIEVLTKEATAETKGLMSSEDKVKLDGINLADILADEVIVSETQPAEQKVGDVWFKILD